LNDVIFVHNQGVREAVAELTISKWATEVAEQRRVWAKSAL